jgi:inositol phosphorylceramide mannosyltransferase catalytic subunit
MKYREEDFNTLVRKSVYYSQNEQDTSVDWKLAKELYENNYLNCEDPTPRITKKIHQIWLGSKLPEKFKRWCDTWPQIHPSWEYKLWTDEDLPNIEITKKEMFYAATNNGMKSDILRYEILRQQGGLYVDTDFECLKPFDDLLYLRFFVGLSYDPNMQTYCGLIGSEKDGLVIGHCVNDLKGIYTGNNGDKIMDTTGPYYITRCLLAGAREQPDGVVAFPMDFFFPFPGDQRFTDKAYTYVRPVSYAIHHWKTSWL